MELKILFEDKHLIVCDKPAGVTSQLGDGNIESLPHALSNYRKSRGENEYIGVVHRLDTVTSGLIVYAKSQKVCSALSNCEYEKYYLTVVQGAPEEKEGTLNDWLFHDKMKNKSYIADSKRKSAKYAELEYDTLQTNNNLTLLKIKLITGRTHQIRVQFASRKMPIVGDGKYGSKENIDNIALHAYILRFKHPITGKMINMCSYPDKKKYPWNYFEFGNEF